jgi:putative serine protease PepD
MPGPAGDEHDEHDDHDRLEAHDDHDHDAEEADEHEAPLGRPPHPLDRVWRHPSELPSDVPSPGTARPGLARRRSREPRLISVALAAAGAGALLTVVVLAAFGVLDDDVAPPETQREVRVASDDAAVARLAAEIAPSIVGVAVLAPDGVRRGSGVCVRHSGDILTSERLVRGAQQVTVTTNEGDVRVATVRGRDPATDLALLQVDDGLPAAPVAQGSLRAGDTVLAVGAANGHGGQPWLGDGIVASVDGVVAQPSGPAMNGLIATNASPGKTGVGGALLDRQGTVVGIVLGPVDGDDSTYALPIGRAARVAEQLTVHGVAAHGWLGIEGGDPSGAPVVTALTENGPAHRAGVEVGDVVVAIGEREVLTMGEVTAAIRWHAPRATVPIKVQRGEDLVRLEVTVGATPREAMLAGA